MERENNKYNMTMEALQMNEKEYEKIKAELIKECGRRERKKGFGSWRKYAAVAAALLCIITMPVAICMGDKYGIFKLFGDSDTEDMIFRYITSDEVVTESENFKVTVLNNMYSSEQQKGLLVCSLVIKNEDKYMLTWIPEKFTSEKSYMPTDEVILRKDRTESAEAYRMGMSVEALRNLDNNSLLFTIGRSEDGIRGTCDEFYMNDKWKDGGYLIGVFYSVDYENGRIINTDDIAVNIGTYPELKTEYSDEMTLKLPATKEPETVEYTSEDMPDSKIVLSPIGINAVFPYKDFYALKMDKNDMYRFDDMIFVYKDGTSVTYRDFFAGHFFAGQISEGTTDAGPGWCMYVNTAMFTEFKDIDKIKIREIEFVR